ncbi:hypothetical protein CHS0354_004957 [Potamilus streckersoni]|uniref:MYCBP-associated protein n=1 Tax=Potamilus streckersoni TaxID=2493646 RepID=A0AAE0RND7_9BIVA|nr:hypothetical protein CHS0354_004957 [Potamilus streckersoni]
MMSRRGSKEQSKLSLGQRERRSSIASQGGKDRLKNKKREGTPDKSGTPSQDALPEDQQPPSRNVIWNEEIEQLQIKEEELQKFRQPQPPSTEHKTSAASSVMVRKIKPASELNKPKPKLVTVAKPAPPDAPIKPMDYSGFSGPRYNADGSVIPHSILGNYEDFRKEAVHRGDLLDFPETHIEPISDVPTLKYEKKRKRTTPYDLIGQDESKALQNWQAKMLERKRQQGHISKLLQKDPEDLVMNQSENYRQIQEHRYMIDRTIPTIDYGKGYRVGSEFWKQQERFGDELTGINMTLTQTEKGYPPPIEHVGLSKITRNERGMTWIPGQTRAMHYPWHKSPFLEQRQKQLQKYIDELDPHKVDFEGLEVIGTNDPYIKQEKLAESPQQTSMVDDGLFEEELNHADNLDPLRDHPDVHQTPIFGPSIQFAGQPARWTGDSFSFLDKIGVEARVTFESYSGDRVTSYLAIVNDGTTAIYYDWKKKAKENPFDLVFSHVQRFYFNNSSGVILPGETMRFPFVFKSPNAGVFHEQWQFETRPTVCGGASLLVTLRGIALQEDKYRRKRLELEADLQRKQAEQVVRQLLNEIIDGLQIPNRPPTPIDSYITEEEIFQRNNPTLHYLHDAVQELKQLYKELYPPEDQVDRYWDLSVDDLKEEVLHLSEDDDRKENFLHQMNSAIARMSFLPNKPLQKQLYQAGYQLLLEAVDSIVSQSSIIRQIMGLPEKELEDISDDFSEGKGKKNADKGKVADKKAPPPAKDPKGGKLSKESTKTDLKGKTTPAASKKPPSRGATNTSMDREQTGSPTTSRPQSGITHDDPVIDKKYKEKLYVQAYNIISDTVSQMEFVFEEIIQNDSTRPTLKL